MAAPKLTPWFPGSVKPVRVGVYERDYDRGYPVYSRWDGKHWLWTYDSSRQAAIEQGKLSPFQNIPWRGLAEEHKQ